MDENEEKTLETAKPGALRGPAESDVGPTGRTRREDQRRRLIITGMATPALMTLPSRRVWATGCTKSKLLSGNLSVNKKGGLQCGELACEPMDWKDSKMHSIAGENWTGFSFNNAVDPGGVVFPNSFSLLNALNKTATPGAHISSAEAGRYKKDLKEVAMQAAAAYLNGVYIKWPYPNDRFDFSLTQADVRTYWGQAVTASLNNNSVDSIKTTLDNANKAGSCPFK